MQLVTKCLFSEFHLFNSFGSRKRALVTSVHNYIITTVFLVYSTALESISAQHQAELRHARQEAVGQGDSTSVKQLQDQIHELEVQLEAKDQVSVLVQSSVLSKGLIYIKLLLLQIPLAYYFQIRFRYS